jgi:hypothetical protein
VSSASLFQKARSAIEIAMDSWLTIVIAWRKLKWGV